MKPLVSVIIPAFNEAKSIVATVASLRAAEEIGEIIVVDDGSSDDTAYLARGMGVTVIELARNCGKGQALQVGCSAAKGDILLLLDGDLAETAVAAIALLEPVATGRIDMTVAVLPLQGIGGFGLVERLSRWAIRRSGGGEPRQPLSGQRALKKDVWRALGGFAGGFGVETALGMAVGHFGYRLLEMPVELSHRRTGRNWQGLWHRGRQFIHVLATILQHWRWLWGP